MRTYLRRRSAPLLTTVSVLLAVFAAGCGSDSSTSNGTETQPGFAFVLNQASRSITVFQRTETETLQAIATLDLDFDPVALDVTNDADELFVLDGQNGRLLMYNISAGGVLSLVQALALSPSPISLYLNTRDPISLYVGCADGTVHYIGENSAGELVIRNSVNINGVPNDITSFYDIFVADSANDQIKQYLFEFAPSVGPTAAGDEPYKLQAYVGGDRLVASNVASSTVSVYDVANTSSSGGPHPLNLIQTVNVGQAPVDLHFDNLRNGLYTVNHLDQTISQLKFVGDINDKMLTYLEPNTVATGPGPTAITRFPDYPRAFALVTCYGSNQLWTYRINTDSTLTFLSHLDVGQGPIDVAAAVKSSFSEY